jgi:hypothetical protein
MQTSGRFGARRCWFGRLADAPSLFRRSLDAMVE